MGKRATSPLNATSGGIVPATRLARAPAFDGAGHSGVVPEALRDS
jgi:hypothetical protein